MTNADWIALVAAIGNWALVGIGALVAWKTLPLEMKKYRAQKHHDARSQAALELWRSVRQLLLQMRTACSLIVHPDARGEGIDIARSSAGLRIAALQQARNEYLESASADLLFQPEEVSTEELWKLSAAIWTELHLSVGPTGPASFDRLRELTQRVDELELKLRSQLQPFVLGTP